MTPVYVDASSAILLYRAGLFRQAARTFSLVLAGEVFRELGRENYPGARLFKKMAQSGIIRVLDREAHDTGCREKTGFAAMDRGERETIAHYLASGETSAAFVLMDDGQGARFCHRHGIPFINALLVPKIFWYSGLMDETRAKEKMNRLSNLGRYSSQIIRKAGQLTPEDLAFFRAGKEDSRG